LFNNFNFAKIHPYNLIKITPFKRKQIKTIKILILLRDWYTRIVRSRTGVKFFTGNEPGNRRPPESRHESHELPRITPEIKRTDLREETTVAIVVGEPYQSRAGIARRIDHSRSRRYGRSNVPIDRARRRS